MDFISGIANVGRTLAGALGLSATTTAARAHVVEETPNNSDSSEDEDQHSTANTAFVFKVEGQLLSTNQNGTTKEEYLDSVLSWSSVGFIGRLRIDRIEPSFSSSSNLATLKHICIGSFTVSDVVEMLQNAADVAGFSMYAHHGAKISGNRCTIGFGCDHGRKRYGDDEHVVTVFEKDLDSIVKDSCRKRKSTRKNHGYDTACTARRRLKHTS